MYRLLIKGLLQHSDIYSDVLGFNIDPEKIGKSERETEEYGQNSSLEARIMSKGALVPRSLL